jgi:hypothetical protein
LLCAHGFLLAVAPTTAYHARVSKLAGDMAENPKVEFRLPKRAFRHIVRWAPLVAPFVYVAAVFAVQPADHMGPPDWAPQLDNHLYDDVDVTVMAQRGLSAQLGQVAGLLDYREAREEEFAAALDEDRPLERVFFLEYPYPAVFIFRLGFLLQPKMPHVPAVVVDTCHVNILHYRPQNERDREIWRRFRWATRIYFLLMLACYFGLVAVLRSGYQANGDLASLGLVLVLPAALYYTLNRFDIVPALLSAVSLWCLGRRRVVASAALLALAAAVKMYAILLAPLFVRYLWSQRREALAWALAFAATLAAVLVIPLGLFGWEAFVAPYRYQMTRVWTMRQTIYDALLPEALGKDTPLGRGFRVGSVVGIVGLLVLPPVPDLASLLRRCAVVLIVFQSVQVFYSPQFIIWLLPFLLPLGARHPGLIWLVAILDVLTIMTFPLGAPTAALYMPVVQLRFLLFGLVVVLLLIWDWVGRARCADGRVGAPAYTTGSPTNPG